MKPDQCTACQHRDLYHTTIEVESSSGVMLRIGLLGKVAVKCSVCLSCGAIVPYLESGELEKLRAWKKKKARKNKATVNE